MSKNLDRKRESTVKVELTEDGLGELVGSSSDTSSGGIDKGSVPAMPRVNAKS